MKEMKKYIFVIIFLFAISCTKQETEKKPVIGIAWRADVDSEFYTNVKNTLDDLGIKNVLLGEIFHPSLQYDGNLLDSSQIDENDILISEYADVIKSTRYKGSNTEKVMKGINAVIFTGGEDIMPTLYANPVPWHAIAEEKDYNATRDISDYLLLTYCIDNDIPVLGICRGAQMLGVVSGATVTQDIPTWLSSLSLIYQLEHRNQKATPESYRDYASHDVTLSSNSKISALFGTTSLTKCASWHHQCVNSVYNTKLLVTGVTNTQGIQMVEGIERTDKTLIVGIQFHPEAAYVKHLKNMPNADNYMTKELAGYFFKSFAEAAIFSNKHSFIDFEFIKQ